MPKFLSWIFAVATTSCGLLAADVDVQDVIPIELLDKAPLALTHQYPAYPDDLRKRGIQGIVFVDFIVDKEGKVASPTVLSSTYPELRKLALSAILTWTFEPGYRNGRPVSTRLQIPVTFWLENRRGLPYGKEFEGDPLNHGPQVVYQGQPIYPSSLGRSGFHGDVYIGFIVDEHGNAVRPEVISSPHPDFETPAVAALLQSKFTPGMVRGQPLPMLSTILVEFGIQTNGMGTLNLDFWKAPPMGSRQLPSQFQYDRPPELMAPLAPVYPYELLTQGIKGNATVTFAVDARGLVHVVKVEAASRPEFGSSLSAMIAGSTFKPATKQGEPCWAFLSKEETFDEKGYGAFDRDFAVNDSTKRLLRSLKKDPCPILTDVHGLDAPLKGLYQPRPAIPEELIRANLGAKALIEFIVDYSGHAQLPRIVSATSAEFGWAAATAVARWQYSAPTRNGKPADVFVRIPIELSPAKTS